MVYVWDINFRKAKKSLRFLVSVRVASDPRASAFLVFIFVFASTIVVPYVCNICEPSLNHHTLYMGKLVTYFPVGKTKNKKESPHRF